MSRTLQLNCVVGNIVPTAVDLLDKGSSSLGVAQIVESVNRGNSNLAIDEHKAVVGRIGDA